MKMKSNAVAEKESSLLVADKDEKIFKQRLKGGVPEAEDRRPSSFNFTAQEEKMTNTNINAFEKEKVAEKEEEIKEENKNEEPLSGRLLIKLKQKNLPDRPGVYRMISASGKVLYVGKAKSLKKRVLNYTQPERLTLRIKQMVSLTHDLIVVECQSEAEAFLLENDLIKRYQPYYNILLKDDKSFPYILIRQNHPFPQVLKYRGKQSAKGRYFGPYASIGAVQEALSTIQKVFQLRVCTDHDFETRSRPCLLYQIKKCSGPCCGMISGEEYRKNVRQALDFMEGKSQRLQKEFSEKMYEASQKEDYETALFYREKIKALNLVQAQSTEHEGYEINGDVFALCREGGSACVQVLFFRSGANKGSKAFFFDQLEGEQTDGDLLQSVLGQFYESVQLPKEIILSHEVEEKELLRESFSQKAGFKVKIETNVRSGRRKILQKALLNAQEALRRHFLEKEVSERDWKGFEELAGLKDIEKIEVYDNSHLQGTSSVGAMIAAGPEGFLKNRYRRFNIDIQTVNPQDDFDMMRHVLSRRLSRGLKEGDLPDVMLIDGGKGQLSAVEEIFQKYPGASKIALIGVAKGPNRDAGEEKLYFPDREEPVCLPKNNHVLHFIQRLRDEAHRFAIGSHRIKRKNNFFRNPLDEIEGIGPKKKKALVEYFGSASKVAQAQVIELIRVPGIDKKLAQAIYDFFHS